MNPSYNSGSSASGVPNTPGVKPGVIASGPDPENVPTVEVPSGAPSGLSLGNSRGFFKKPRAAVPKRTMPMGGGNVGGGIDISGGNSQGSKKGLVIVGLLVIVVLIVGLFVGVMMGGGKKGGSGSSDADFNRLINYITTGEDSTDSVEEEYSVTDDYYFLNGWKNMEQKKEIYDETKTLMDNFVAEYEDGENGALNNLVKTTKEQFDFMYVVDLKVKNPGVKIIETGIKNGKEKAKKSSMNYYDLSGLGENTYATDFLEAYEKWVDALLDKVEFYNVNGCIVDNNLSDACMITKNDEELEKKRVEIANLIDNVYDSVLSYYNTVDSYLPNVYDINILLRGDNIMEIEDE